MRYHRYISLFLLLALISTPVAAYTGGCCYPCGGIGSTYYPYQKTYWLNDTTIAPTTDHEVLLSEPNTNISTVSHSVTVKAADGLKLIDRYITPQGDPGVTMILGNEWRFFNYASVDANTGLNFVVIYGNITDANGTPYNNPPLFISRTEPFTTSVPQYAQTRVAVGRITLNKTDRIAITYYANTTSAADRIITLYHNGQEYYTHVATYT